MWEENSYFDACDTFVFGFELSNWSCGSVGADERRRMSRLQAGGTCEVIKSSCEDRRVKIASRAWWLRTPGPALPRPRRRPHSERQAVNLNVMKQLINFPLEF